MDGWVGPCTTLGTGIGIRGGRRGGGGEGGSTTDLSKKSSLLGTGGLWAIRQEFPPARRIACTRNKFTLSGTAAPTPPKLLWSQNPRIFTGSEFRESPSFASNSTALTPVVTFKLSTDVVVVDSKNNCKRAEYKNGRAMLHNCAGLSRGSRTDKRAFWPGEMATGVERAVATIR